MDIEMTLLILGIVTFLVMAFLWLIIGAKED